MDPGDGMGKKQGDVKVIQALDYISGQAARIGHDFDTGHHLGPLQGHAPGHNQADVPGSQNHDPAAHHVAFHVDIALGRPGRQDTRHPAAGRLNGPPGPFPATHGQDDCLAFQGPVALTRTHEGHPVAAPMAVKGKNHGVAGHLDVTVHDLIDQSTGIFGPGQLFLEIVEAKAIVDALVEDTPQFQIPLHNQDPLQAGLPGRQGGTQTGRSSPDDDTFIAVKHPGSPPCFPLSGVCCRPHPPGWIRDRDPSPGPGSPGPWVRKSHPGSDPCRSPPAF